MSNVADRPILTHSWRLPRLRLYGSLIEAITCASRRLPLRFGSRPSFDPA